MGTVLWFALIQALSLWAPRVRATTLLQNCASLSCFCPAYTPPSWGDGLTPCTAPLSSPPNNFSVLLQLRKFSRKEDEHSDSHKSAVCYGRHDPSPAFLNQKIQKFHGPPLFTAEHADPRDLGFNEAIMFLMSEGGRLMQSLYGFPIEVRVIDGIRGSQHHAKQRRCRR